MLKEIYSLLALGLTVISFGPYILMTLRGTIKPHFYSWLIWGIATLVVFFAQLQAGGGVGAWPIGFSGLVSSFIAVLAFLKRGDSRATTSDLYFLIAALAALPVWYFTADPLWAVALLTTVDLLGFLPTLRRAYHRPHQESLYFFSLFSLRNFMAILALEQLSFTTVFFPAATGLMAVFLILLVALRRRRASQQIYPVHEY